VPSTRLKQSNDEKGLSRHEKTVNGAATESYTSKVLQNIPCSLTGKEAEIDNPFSKQGSWSHRQFKNKVQKPTRQSRQMHLVLENWPKKIRKIINWKKQKGKPVIDLRCCCSCFVSVEIKKASSRSEAQRDQSQYQIAKETKQLSKRKLGGAQ
jgi:hypothetical protein